MCTCAVALAHLQYSSTKRTTLSKEEISALADPDKNGYRYEVRREEAFEKLYEVLSGPMCLNSEPREYEVAKKAGCKNSQLMHSEKEIPFKDIDNSDTIGISSGASAPEKLVQTLLNNIKKDRKVSIEEVVVAEEKVVFKLPKELN